MPKVTRVQSGGYRTREDYSHDSPDPDEGYIWSEEAGAMVPKPAEPKPDTRVTPTGITQTGKNLGLKDINGLFASLNERGQMSKGDLPSANKFFSEALPTTPEGTEQQSPPAGETSGENNGAVIEPTVPGTLGGNPDNAEDGTSSKPDIAEEVRTIRMKRNSGRGSRRDPRNRDGGSDEPFGGVSETKGNGMSAERRAARAAFLDPNNKGYGAIRARDRAVGAFHQYDTGGMNIDGKVYNFKDGMSKDARFELSGGKIDSKEAAQAFMNKYIQGFGEAAPTDSPVEPPVSEQTQTTLTPDVPRNPSTAEKPSNPKIIDSTAPHPDTGRKPDAATEASNSEYGAMKFKFDPEKGMMVPVQ